MGTTIRPVPESPRQISHQALDRPRFHLVGGKGGVGKTTCAAALGLAAAAAGARVLVVSTDPAPSLGDALGLTLTASPTRIPLRRGVLHAAEIDASTSLRRWIAKRRSVLESIAEHGTWLDREDVARLLGLSFPGIDELAALFEIARLAGEHRFDQIVIDTAPTGHTLRMLSMPQTLAGIAGVFELMREKQRVVQEVLRGRWTAGAEDALIEELTTVARQLIDLFRNPSRTALTWVTLPEPMAVAETADALQALRAAGIRARSLIVNQLTPWPERACGHCNARIVLERRAIRQLPALAATHNVHQRVVEPQGVRALSSIAAELQTTPPRSGSRSRSTVWRAAPFPGQPVEPASLGTSARLVLFGGKGGVGKTTCAATVAISAAASNPERRVLLISVDPAHSLGDILDGPVSDVPATVSGGPPNLDVRELDASRLIAGLRTRYASAIDRTFDRMTGGGSFDISHDRAVMRALIELAPPGLDELAAVLQIVEALDADPSVLVIMDTAPTGHALRLLETPALVHDWVRALMSILLKYRDVTTLGSLGGMLLDLSKRIGRLREILIDPVRASFIVVTRPAALPRMETLRLLRRLSRLRLHVPALIVNAVGRGECRRCRQASAAQLREAVRIRNARRHRPQLSLILAPTHLPPPHGAGPLRRWGKSWRQVDAAR